MQVTDALRNEAAAPQFKPQRNPDHPFAGCCSAICFSLPYQKLICIAFSAPSSCCQVLLISFTNHPTKPELTDTSEISVNFSQSENGF
jgi:hypothetical protein